ncbi:hypothetical protein H0H92_005141 [Tricholoma furcatifolium]|nr:hypothetical protein H0H92_005141 [Tricholoma furcatifolium]
MPQPSFIYTVRNLDDDHIRPPSPTSSLKGIPPSRPVSYTPSQCPTIPSTYTTDIWICSSNSRVPAMTISHDPSATTGITTGITDRYHGRRTPTAMPNDTHNIQRSDGHAHNVKFAETVSNCDTRNIPPKTSHLNTLHFPASHFVEHDELKPKAISWPRKLKSSKLTSPLSPPSNHDPHASKRLTISPTAQLFNAHQIQSAESKKEVCHSRTFSYDQSDILYNSRDVAYDDSEIRPVVASNKGCLNEKGIL